MSDSSLDIISPEKTTYNVRRRITHFSTCHLIAVILGHTINGLRVEEKWLTSCTYRFVESDDDYNKTRDRNKLILWSRPLYCVLDTHFSSAWKTSSPNVMFLMSTPKEVPVWRDGDGDENEEQSSGKWRSACARRDEAIASWHNFGQSIALMLYIYNLRIHIPLFSHILARRMRTERKQINNCELGNNAMWRRRW